MSTWKRPLELLVAVLRQAPEPLPPAQVQVPQELAPKNRAERRALARVQAQEALRRAARAPR